MSRDYYRNRCKLGSLPQILTTTPVFYLFFDDFLGSSLNSTYWTGAGSYGVTSGYAYVNGIQGTSQITPTSNVQKINKGQYIEIKGSLQTTSMSYHVFSITDGGSNTWYWGYRWENSSTLCAVINGTNVYTQSAPTSYNGIFKIEYTSDGYIKFYLDGNLKYTSSGTYNASNLSFGGIGCYDSGKQSTVDYIKIGNI